MFYLMVSYNKGLISVPIIKTIQYKMGLNAMNN